MITSYKKAKEDILQFYREFLQVVEKVGMPSDDTSLTSLRFQAKKIEEDKFCLMVAGEAKSGKSTFINAYLGTEILPMDVRQCTSSVVEIRYGSEFHLKAIYADGKEKTFVGENDIKRFLISNAALDDQYRDIPVTIINNEIIVKYKDRPLPDQIIRDMLKGVERENIHRLPPEVYERKIRKYIAEKRPKWREVVVTIEIEYPFEDKNMRGIRIIDSPGVNAAGKVGDVTATYIESADAIMFLRPITGVAIEANSFKEFLESKSVDRNKNAMFLILTRAAAESDETISRAYEEFVNMFGTQKTDNRHGIVKEQIIPVDSKAEMYYNLFQKMTTEEIKTAVKEMNAAKQIEPFLKAAWFDADGEKDVFLKELKRYSNFSVIDQSLNKFGRKAQFIALSEFLGRMLKVYAKIAASLRDQIGSYQLKAEDPQKLAAKVEATNAELIEIENLMRQKVDEIVAKYASSGKRGLIAVRAEEVMRDYRATIDTIKGTSDSCIDELEKHSFRQIETFQTFEKELQNTVVNECEEALKVALRGKGEISFVTLAPDFSPEVVKQIKDTVRKDSYESYTYETGITFKKTHTGSRFSQDKFFKNVKNSIVSRLESIKAQAVRDLTNFVQRTARRYAEELAKNADAKRNELERIKAEKATADEIAATIARLESVVADAGARTADLESYKGGIDNYV